jgi:hypothetical protein
MKNVEMSMDGKTLVIKIDTAKRFGPSTSGKTIIVASTEGNQKIPGETGIILDLNAYVKP